MAASNDSVADDKRQPAFDDEWLLDTIRLALVDGVGPKTWDALLDRFGTPSAVLRASKGLLSAVQGVGPKLAQRIKEMMQNWSKEEG